MQMSNLYVGQKVKIGNTRKGDYSRVSWVSDMDECLGKVGIVTIDYVTSNCVKIRIPKQGEWTFTAESIVCEVK